METKRRTRPDAKSLEREVRGQKIDERLR